jgi:hypothetical protein
VIVDAGKEKFWANGQLRGFFFNTFFFQNDPYIFAGGGGGRGRRLKKRSFLNKRSIFLKNQSGRNKRYKRKCLGFGTEFSFNNGCMCMVCMQDVVFI